VPRIVWLILFAPFFTEYCFHFNTTFSCRRFFKTWWKKVFILAENKFGVENSKHFWCKQEEYWWNLGAKNNFKTHKKYRQEMLK